MKPIFSVILIFILHSTYAQSLDDYKIPKYFKILSSQDGSIEISSKVEYNGESLLLFINGQLSAVLTDIVFIRNQITEGVKCKAFHAYCTTDKEQNTILIAENGQFILFKQPGDTFVLLTNKSVSAYTKKPLTTEDEIKQMTLRWNQAVLTRDFNDLIYLYNEDVLYYGQIKKSKECVGIKRNYIAKNPDFNQRIIGELDVKIISDFEAICHFSKEVFIVSSKSKVYQSYLYFVKNDDRWEISVESDEITDKNTIYRSVMPDETISGDFNGDGILDMMWLQDAIAIPGTEFSTLNNTSIHFNNINLPHITTKNNAGGYLLNLGDLADNGYDMIGFWQYNIMGCWRSFYVYTLNKGKWILAVDPFQIHCDYWDEEGPVVKDSKNPGHVIITETEVLEDGEWRIAKKSVRLRNLNN